MKQKKSSTPWTGSAGHYAAGMVEQLVTVPALDHPDLVADPVAAALKSWPQADQVSVGAIDPTFADTVEFCEHYGEALDESANCVIVAAKRAGEIRYAACLVLASMRADINGRARRHLDARKISFAPMETAVELTGVEYGGITPIGLPADWPILVDSAVAERPRLVIGSGLRGSKIAISGAAIAELPGAEVLEGLAQSPR